MGVRREYMFQTREDEDKAWRVVSISSEEADTGEAYDKKQVWIAIKTNDSEGVEPLPHLVRFLWGR